MTGGTIGFLWPNLSRGFGGTIDARRHRRRSRPTRPCQGATLRDGAPAYFRRRADVRPADRPSARLCRRRQHRRFGRDDQRAGAVSALPAPGLQAQLLHHQLLVRVPLPRLALRPARASRSASSARRRAASTGSPTPSRAACSRWTPARSRSARCPSHSASRGSSPPDRRRAAYERSFAVGLRPLLRAKRRLPARPERPSLAMTRSTGRERPAADEPGVLRARAALPTRPVERPFLRRRPGPHRRPDRGACRPGRPAERQRPEHRVPGHAARRAVHPALLVVRHRAARARHRGAARKEADEQYVTDVSRGYALFLANCARCHTTPGPPATARASRSAPERPGQALQTLTRDGLPGTGHLNPDYIHSVLREGGRYVCGDSNSVMPAWLEPKGPLNYREVEEIIDFILASKDTEFVVPAGSRRRWRHASAAGGRPGLARPGIHARARRDPRAGLLARPDRRMAVGAATPAPVTSPGTAENPRVIEVHGNAQSQWVDAERPAGVPNLGRRRARRSSSTSTNDADRCTTSTSAPRSELSTAPEHHDLPGVDTFAGRHAEFTYTVDTCPNSPQFACTVPGHYSLMNGDLVVVPGRGRPGIAWASGAPSTPAPAASGGANPPPSAAPQASSAVGYSPRWPSTRCRQERSVAGRSSVCSTPRAGRGPPSRPRSGSC